VDKRYLGQIRPICTRYALSRPLGPVAAVRASHPLLSPVPLPILTLPLRTLPVDGFQAHEAWRARRLSVSICGFRRRGSRL